MTAEKNNQQLSPEHPPLAPAPRLPVSDRYRDGRSLIPGIWTPIYPTEPTPESMDADEPDVPEYHLWACGECGRPTLTKRVDVGKSRPSFVIVWICPKCGPICPPPSLGVEGVK